MAGVDDMSQRIGSLVAVSRRIRQFADAHAIQDDDDCFLVHLSPPIHSKKDSLGYYTAISLFFQSCLTIRITKENDDGAVQPIHLFDLVQYCVSGGRFPANSL